MEKKLGGIKKQIRDLFCAWVMFKFVVFVVAGAWLSLSAANYGAGGERRVYNIICNSPHPTAKTLYLELKGTEQ